jgi:uncharacterized protein DUF3828
MIRRLAWPRVIAATFASTVFASTALAAEQRPDPVETIRALYAADAPFINNTGPGVMGSGKLLARFLSADLNRAITADAKAAAKRKDTPTIDGDLFVDSQEGGAKDFKIARVAAEADKTQDKAQDRAQVRAEFDKGAGEREEVTFSMVFQRGAWRIDDIAYKRADGSGETVREILKGQ